jgi:hypothetical protein
VPITLLALQGAIDKGLGRADLAERLPVIGDVFTAAIKLREDSNYESLILAHQYFHRPPPDFTDVPGVFSVVTEGMLSANRLVLQFTGELLLATFNDDRPWFCPSTAFRASHLLQLLLAYVKTKIRSYSKGGEHNFWAEHLSPLDGLLSAASFPTEGEARNLSTRLPAFTMERGIMRDFDSKVGALRRLLP